MLLPDIPTSIIIAARNLRWNRTLEDLEAEYAETERRFAGTDIPFADRVTASKQEDGLIRLTYAVYYKEDDKWFEENSRLFVESDVVPEFILSKPEGADGEVDITNEIKHAFVVKKNLFGS